MDRFHHMRTLSLLVRVYKEKIQALKKVQDELIRKKERFEQERAAVSHHMQEAYTFAATPAFSLTFQAFHKKSTQHAHYINQKIKSVDHLVARNQDNLQAHIKQMKIYEKIHEKLLTAHHHALTQEEQALLDDVGSRTA